MDTPLRRSRRLEGLKPEATENLASAGRVRRALAKFESGPEATQQPGPGSPPRPPESSVGPPGLPRGADAGSPRGQRGPSPESPPRQPEARPEAPQSEESPGSPPRHLKSGPGSPEPEPGPPAPGPEPTQPPQEQTPRAPGSSKARRELSAPCPAAETVSGGLGAKKRRGPSDQAPASKKLKREEEEALPAIPKGKPKSGRVWKDRSKKRFSQMVQDKPLHTSWKRKMKERQERQLARDFARHLEEEKARRRQEKKQRRAENLRRRLENERRAEVVQVIRNPAKLKRAKKKQLRAIQKRDTLALLQKQPPRRPGAEA
ncbi:coiled-coil domain-containing protein 86 [Heterocephalus glaber]|uniref:Coiled-coil domain-containing protein 86 n=1 Tax=Heterocephalus glaber TaxID=10181 RepID=A0AAX6QFG8_HETGA|nr:coiled-coil domain-containing protein 86 [Heterocephalus glaber]